MINQLLLDIYTPTTLLSIVLKSGLFSSNTQLSLIETSAKKMTPVTQWHICTEIWKNKHHRYGLQYMLPI